MKKKQTLKLACQAQIQTQKHDLDQLRSFTLGKLIVVNPARSGFTPRCAQSRPAYLVSATHSASDADFRAVRHELCGSQQAQSALQLQATPASDADFHAVRHELCGSQQAQADVRHFVSLSIKPAPVVPPGTQEGEARSPTE